MTRLRLTIAAPYGLLWLAAVAFYPTLRGDVLLWLYGAAELAGGVFVVGCFGWRSLYLATARQNSVKVTWNPNRNTDLCTLALTSASLATTLLPALQGPAMVAGWPTITTVWCVALGVVLGAQGWELLR